MCRSVTIGAWIPRKQAAGHTENRSLLAARCSASQLSLTVPTSIHDRDLGLRQSRRPSTKAATATPTAARTNGSHIWSISNDSRFAGGPCTAPAGPAITYLNREFRTPLGNTRTEDYPDFVRGGALP